VRAIFFAMITLAVAAAFQTLASQLSDWTGGEDGLTFKMPEWLSPSFELFENEIFGILIDGRIISYYLLFAVAVVLVLMLLRIVNSPFGRVLQAIRENEFRAEAIGYRVVVYRTTSSVLSALFACVAGAMLAVWLRYNGPDTSLSFEIMMDCLLIVVIGGMGTIYGAVIGSVIFLSRKAICRICCGWQRSRRQPAMAVGPAVAGPLAAVAGSAVRAVGLLLPYRRGGPAARGCGAQTLTSFTGIPSDCFHYDRRQSPCRRPMRLPCRPQPLRCWRPPC
jgi:ABC-type branched-subunit amino acid transport system permease subunit